MLYRHGDVLIARIEALRPTATPSGDDVLMHGELTGHSHRVQNGATATVYADRGDLFLRVLEEATTIVHQEHAPISLPRGTYRVWQQREYTPGPIRRVAD